MSSSNNKRKSDPNWKNKSSKKVRSINWKTSIENAETIVTSPNTYSWDMRLSQYTFLNSLKEGGEISKEVALLAKKSVASIKARDENVESNLNYGTDTMTKLVALLKLVRSGNTDEERLSSYNDIIVIREGLDSTITSHFVVEMMLDSYLDEHIGDVNLIEDRVRQGKMEEDADKQYARTAISDNIAANEVRMQQLKDQIARIAKPTGSITFGDKEYPREQIKGKISGLSRTIKDCKDKLGDTASLRSASKSDPRVREMEGKVMGSISQCAEIVARCTGARVTPSNVIAALQNSSAYARGNCLKANIKEVVNSVRRKLHSDLTGTNTADRMSAFSEGIEYINKVIVTGSISITAAMDVYLNDLAGYETKKEVLEQLHRESSDDRYITEVDRIRMQIHSLGSENIQMEQRLRELL